MNSCVKKCLKCGEIKPIEEMVLCNQRKDGRGPYCKICINTRQKKRYANEPGYKQYRRDMANRLRRQNWERNMAYEARWRATKKGIPFAIDASDIEIPENCPVFGWPLVIGQGKKCDQSASLDAINPSLGYIPGNIQVISSLANLMKNKATAEQLQRFAKWVLSTDRCNMTEKTP